MIPVKIMVMEVVVVDDDDCFDKQDNCDNDETNEVKG